MKVLQFSTDHTSLKIGILIKEAALELTPMTSYYTSVLEEMGIPQATLVGIGLQYGLNNKITAKDGKAYAAKLLSAVDALGVDTLLVCDSAYYKFFTKLTKTTNKIGAVEPCAIKGYEHINILLGVNYQALFYNDALREGLTESLKALYNFISKGQTEIGTHVIHGASYPSTVLEIRTALKKLKQYGALTCDIETFSLRFNKAGIATIAFAWDQHNGIAFDVAHTQTLQTQSILRLLREFFSTYKGNLIFHNSLYDVKVLVYTLYMKNGKDYIGMQEGLQTFKNIHDSQVLTYIALNSTAEIKLNLKANALEFAGDYAQDDITDVTKIDLPTLLEYNLVDCLCTWYLVNKHDDVLSDPKLLNFYKTIGQPSLIPTIKMMLVGLPLDMDQVLKTESQLRRLSNLARGFLASHQWVKAAEKIIAERACIAANLKLKKLVKTPDQFWEPFNPGSPIQVRVLLHEVMGIEITDFTKTKQPSTKVNVLQKFHDLTKIPNHKPVLNALIELSGTEIILNNFIKNFKELAFFKEPGEPWLNGNLKTTGTQGLRYSSSDPNMQNMPSTSQWAELIKLCFKAPPGYVIGGADFSSLEDRINAILTQDPNKVKVYTDGYDGHCLRAYAYFASEMPDITDDVIGINSIKTMYPEVRQRSKVPTFALTYEGTYYTLVKNLGLTVKAAKSIEEGYHDLYKVSDEFSRKNIEYAAKHGYVELAFGAKLRTPMLKQTVINSIKTPYEAEKEGRSANNAITQSWGVLTNRAVIEFEERLLARLDLWDQVLICNVIHDAIYVLMKKDADVIGWVNENLIQCMQWNDHPAIKSKDVPMEAELDIGPNLGSQVTIPNNATRKEIESILEELVFK